MRLALKWKSKYENIYSLGILSKENEKYIFEINENELKKAIKDGCIGIGDFNFLSTRVESDELFNFFKYRIPRADSPRIAEFLEEFNMDHYDEMHILRVTGARSMNDRYWVEEI